MLLAAACSLIVLQLLVSFLGPASGGGADGNYEKRLSKIEATLADGLPDLAGPIIASASAKFGLATGGMSITIKGRNFDSGAIVLFGGREASGVDVVASKEDASITCTVPAAAGPGLVDLEVRNNAGASYIRRNYFRYTKKLKITWPAPAEFTTGQQDLKLSGEGIEPGLTLAEVDGRDLNADVEAGAVTFEVPARPAGTSANVTVKNGPHDERKKTFKYV